jgi:hypothetical protein
MTKGAQKHWKVPQKSDTSKIWVVEDYGIDGARLLDGTITQREFLVKYNGTFTGMTTNIFMGFYSMESAQTFVEYREDMASYYTGDPGQRYDAIDAVRKETDKWLSTKSYLRGTI